MQFLNDDNSLLNNEIGHLILTRVSYVFFSAEHENDIRFFQSRQVFAL